MMPNGILLAQDHFTGVSKMIACLSLQRISSALRKRVGESGIMFGAGKTRELLTDERAAMEAYKREFIEFMVQSDVLKFGDFTLKSGRKSPFFMNAGAYVTGEQLHRLGLYYAQAINDNFGLDFDVVFGPAYKGIPLAVVTAMALQELYGKEVKYCCNIMVEDVTTSGKSIDETYPILKAAADVDVRGLIVSLNRMEVGKGGVTTAQKEIEAKYGFPVASIVSMAEVKECLHNHEVAGRIVIDDDIAAAIDAYYEQWGAKE